MIDFSVIGKAINEHFDTDFMDVKRDVSGGLEEVYSNIPCHISYSDVDNPNSETVDVKPIIQSLTINMPLWVDVRNNDFLVLKKAGLENSLLAVYSGRCGNPVVSQGRKKVVVAMSGTESEDPTPIPPKNFVNVTIKFLQDNIEIKEPLIKEVEKNSSFIMEAPYIEGFSPRGYVVDDGEEQEDATAYIQNVEDENHVVAFLYFIATKPDYFRILMNGLYTKDDGSLANGYHFYKKLKITFLSKDDGIFTITCDDVNLVHEDSGKDVFISVGTKMLLTPGDVFVEVTSILRRSGGLIVFTAEGFVPTDEERNAYVTRWYD